MSQPASDQTERLGWRSDPAFWLEAVVAALGIWALHALFAVGLGRSFDQTLTSLWAPALAWTGFVAWPRRMIRREPVDPPDRPRQATIEAGLPTPSTFLFAVVVGTVVAWLLDWLPWWPAWAALTLGVARPLWVQRHTPAENASRRLPTRRDGLFLLLAVALAVATVAFIYRPDADDTLYVALAVEALEESSTPLLAYDPVHGEPGVPLIPSFYRLQSYEILVAVLSRMTGLSVVALYYLILPILSATFAVAALWLLASWISAHHAGPIALLTVLVLIAWGGDPQAIGNFGFVRMFQGKAIFATAMVPMLIHCTLEHFRRPTWRSVTLLLLAQAGSVALTVTALFLAPMCVAAVLLSEAFTNRRQFRAALWAASPWLLALPFVAQLALRERHDGLLASLGDSPFEIWNLLGGPTRTTVVLISVVAAPALLSRSGWSSAAWLRRYLLASCLILLWSPPMFGLLNTLDLGSVSWRLVWTFPFAIVLAAIGVAALAGSSQPLRLRLRRPATALATGLLLVFFLAAPWTVVEANGSGRMFPTDKWKTDRWRAAERVVAATDPTDLAIIAQPISNFVPRLAGGPRLVAARYSSTYLPFSQTPADASDITAWRRFQILNFVSGQPQGEADSLADFEFADEVRQLSPRAILLVPEVAGNRWLERNLLEMDFRPEIVESWTLWTRKAGMGNIPEPLEARPDPFIAGFYEPEGNWRWMSEDAEVHLLRDPEHTGWLLRGYIDLALHEPGTLKVAVSVDGAAAIDFEINQTGPFTLQGPIDVRVGNPVEIQLRCNRHFKPSNAGQQTDNRSLCVVVNSVGLIDRSH